MTAGRFVSFRNKIAAWGERLLGGPRFDWLQVEVTTRCQAACRYCPRTCWRDVWEGRDLPLAVFARLAPAFRHAGHIHLQGWGEPLLHPDFFTMVSQAKAAGCRVGVTTNGLLVDEGMAERLAASGLDVLALSLAGLGQGHDLWRPGAPFHRVLEGVRLLARAKQRLGVERPAIHIAYLLLRSGLPDLERLPEALAGLGLDQVVVSTLDLVAAPDLAWESLAAAAPGERDELAARLRRAAAAAARRGLLVHGTGLEGRRHRPLCPENILKALVVSARGDVSPCVFTNLPNGAVHFPRGRPQLLHPLSFGNVAETSLPAIWRRAEYAAFRRAFRRGEPARSCRDCLKFAAPPASSSKPGK